MIILKKIFLSIALLAFGVVLVAISIVRDQANAIKVKPSMNQPAYIFEVVQDRITQWLTFDNKEKLRLWLSYADERWLSADSLLHSKQEASGLLTARKAIGYQSKAVDQIESMRTNSQDIKTAMDDTKQAVDRGERLMINWQKEQLIQDSAEWESLIRLSNYNLERLTNISQNN